MENQIPKSLIKKILSRNPPTIKNKIECYTLYESGFFGNKIRTWNTLQKVLDSNHQGTVSIRSKKISWKTKFNIPVQELPTLINYLKKQNINVSELTFNETPPDHHLIFQGEIMRTPNGLYFLYSNEKAPMKIALRKQSKSITGIQTQNLLKAHLDPNSLNNIFELLDLFPNDIIEFSTFSINLGNIKGRNTIIWEVRGY